MMLCGEGQLFISNTLVSAKRGIYSPSPLGFLICLAAVEVLSSEEETPVIVKVIQQEEEEHQ